MDYEKRLAEIRKKEYYREAVKRRNMEILEEKKNKTLWKLEKIDLKERSRGNSPGSLERGYGSSRAY